MTNPSKKINAGYISTCLGLPALTRLRSRGVKLYQKEMIECPQSGETLFTGKR